VGETKGAKRPALSGPAGIVTLIGGGHRASHQHPLRRRCTHFPTR
jgi:hypothetical protein